MKKITVTIGIPAFNEEKNIARLLLALKKQKISFAQLTKIIVVSDHSTDATVLQVKKIKDKKIELIENTTRQGVVHAKNIIISRTTSDFLLLLDADVIPKDNNFLSNIMTTALCDSAIGLVGAQSVSMPGNTFAEKIISYSHGFKNTMYKQINNGNNLYLCHGRALCLSRKFYKRLNLKNGYPEDSFMYLTCMQLQMKFAFSPHAIVLFRSPATFSDHMLQSTRYLAGKRKLENYFAPVIVENAYAIPLRVSFPTLLMSTIMHPIMMLFYTIVFISMEIYSLKKITYTSKWKIATTSKNLIV